MISVTLVSSENFHLVTYFACLVTLLQYILFLFTSTTGKKINLIWSVVISSTANTTEHQVQGGLLWGTLTYMPVKLGVHKPRTSRFYIPGQFKWLATLQGLVLHFLWNRYEGPKQKTTALICTNFRGLVCTHKQGRMHNIPALNLGFIKNWVCVYTESVWIQRILLEYLEGNLGVGFISVKEQR